MSWASLPGVGEIAGGASALIYLAKGDKVNTALNAAVMILRAGMVADRDQVWKVDSSGDHRSPGKKVGVKQQETGSIKHAPQD